MRDQGSLSIPTADEIKIMAKISSRKSGITNNGRELRVIRKKFDSGFNTIFKVINENKKKERAEHRPQTKPEPSQTPSR